MALGSTEGCKNQSKRLNTIVSFGLSTPELDGLQYGTSTETDCCVLIFRKILHTLHSTLIRLNGGTFFTVWGYTVQINLLEWIDSSKLKAINS